MTSQTSQTSKEDLQASVAEAEAKLARLGAQVEAMQGMLVRLLQEVVRAEKRLRQTDAVPLAEVNEQLVVAALASQADADAASKALQAATQSATHDLLTGLPNRLMLLDHFAQAAATARRHDGRCALLFLDLDDFKRLNDGHGHAFGDRVLQQVARRLVAAVREIDTVSRHGGDEFLVLLAELDQPGDAQRVADKLADAVSAPIEIDGTGVGLGVSVGVAICPDDGEDFDTLVVRADAAMYASKRRHAARRSPAGGPADEVAATQPSGAAPAAPDPAAADASPPDAHAGSAGADAAHDADRLLADLREANERLVLAAMDAQELQAAADRARQRQAALLTAAMDELRNPMAPIRLAAMMLGRPAAEEPLLPRVQQILGHQIDQMGRLADAVKLERGGLHLELARIDLARVAEETSAMHRVAMDPRGQRFTVQRPPGPVEVMGDVGRLRLLLSNLLDNATRYTHEGGHIRLSITADAAKATLSVSDNGIGIPPLLLPLVFEPFVQDPRALAYSGTGLGIGLTVARALARAHGGDIHAESAGVNRGSCFTLTLPLATPRDAAPGLGPARTPAGGGEGS